MSELLFFTLGLVIGGLTGISVMCLFQINRLYEYEECKKEDDFNEKKIYSNNKNR